MAASAGVAAPWFGWRFCSSLVPLLRDKSNGPDEGFEGCLLSADQVGGTAHLEEPGYVSPRNHDRRDSRAARRFGSGQIGVMALGTVDIHGPQVFANLLLADRFEA